MKIKTKWYLMCDSPNFHSNYRHTIPKEKKNCFNKILKNGYIKY